MTGLGWWLAATGWAGSWGQCANSTHAPADYVGAPCVGICSEVTQVGLHALTCDLDQGGGLSTIGMFAEAYDVGDSFSAWGIDNNGDEFCCYYDDTNDDVTDLWLYGTDGTDTLDFDDAWAPPLTVGSYAWGHAGNDTLRGADIATVNGNSDALYGEGGDDVIVCGGGDDFATGGSQGDTIWGGPGYDNLQGNGGIDLLYGGDNDDQVFGGDNNDDITGGDGNDIADGEDGDDVVRGNAGHDIVAGGLGADIVCGGGTTAGTDYLYAYGLTTGTEFPDSADKLWQPYNASNPDPVGYSQGNDSCGDADWGDTWAGGSCDYSLTFPSECN